jgi:hypothetical protein
LVLFVLAVEFCFCFLCYKPYIHEVEITKPNHHPLEDSVCHYYAIKGTLYSLVWQKKKKGTHLVFLVRNQGFRV